MKAIYRLILLIILFLLPAIVVATTPAPPTEGPIVPCVGCENLTQAPYPEAGLWSNPEQSPGSGLNFEIQNGVLTGFLYTYTGIGKPDWVMLSGQLVRSEKAGVLWELDTRLIRVEGGRCISCVFTPPDQITKGMTIRLEFLQRNYLRISIGGVFDQFFVPFIYGSGAKAFYSEQTPYLFPLFGVGQEGSRFIVSLRPVNTTQDNRWVSYHVSIPEVRVTGSGVDIRLSYSLHVLDPHGPIASPQPPPIGEIICQLDETTQQPGCEVIFEEVSYLMPIGNLSDSRFFAEAEDGSIIEGFRFEYD
ncbi:MAG: hypothetical protein IMF09_07145 [Proteobacteria bacterium]|nr:hypothetical protein [Pseudomonadota bacterium]